jgi:pantoate kinase
MDPGIAQLQRGAAASSPDVASALAEARGRQVAGYRGVLDDLAGNDGTREFFESARDATADSLYSQARAGGLQMDDALQAQVGDLLKRPSVQSAVEQAKVLAKEKGIDITNPSGSATGLMYVDDALSDQIGSAARAGNNKLVAALRDTQDQLRSFLDEAAPAYGEARRTYAEMSRPINQMAIGQTLRDKALPALDDLGNGSLARVNANSYANALRNADRTAAQATGLRSATMANVLEPAQMDAVQGIGQDMARYASAQELGRVPGSPTAQYLGAQNVIRQFLGPLGIPQSAADSMIGRVASGLLDLPFRLTQSQTEQLLARALTEPGVAAKIMSTTDPKTIAEMLQPFAAQLAIQGQIE